MSKKRKFSLRTIYLTIFTLVFAISVGVYVAFDVYVQQKQTESMLVEEARTFAREMDAVWRFIDNSQTAINYTRSGIYEFKGIHCSIVGKSVGAIFSAKSDYSIRYTNFNPRNALDTPDAFETLALESFYSSGDTREYYGFAEYKGKKRFRYLQALSVDESCMMCHGEPAGEIDITGRVKEGWTLGSVGGAISIVIPLEQQNTITQSNMVRNISFFLLLTLFIGGTIFIMSHFFVFRPLKRMQVAFGDMSDGRLSVSLDDSRTAREISHLITDFNTMAADLRGMHESLESQVIDRTIALQEANADLEKLSENLAKEARFKSDLLSMVNHELRTPLTSIIALAQTTKNECGDEDKNEYHAWEEIEKNSNILLEMINNMLDIARSDAGEIATASEPIDLGDVVEAVKSTIVPLAQKYRVSFNTAIASDVPLITGDSEKTKRILENLASNAIKFTPDSGNIRLMIERDAKNGDVCLKVTDDGIGIAVEDQARIFDRFIQVDSTSTRKYNGSGLGLAIVKEHSELQGFEVSVQSTLGEGSTFIVRIPQHLTIADE